MCAKYTSTQSYAVILKTDRSALSEYWGVVGCTYMLATKLHFCT